MIQQKNNFLMLLTRHLSKAKLSKSCEEIVER